MLRTSYTNPSGELPTGPALVVAVHDATEKGGARSHAVADAHPHPGGCARPEERARTAGGVPERAAVSPIHPDLQAANADEPGTVSGSEVPAMFVADHWYTGEHVPERHHRACPCFLIKIGRGDEHVGQPGHGAASIPDRTSHQIAVSVARGQDRHCWIVDESGPEDPTTPVRRRPRLKPTHGSYRCPAQPATIGGRRRPIDSLGMEKHLESAT